MATIQPARKTNILLSHILVQLSTPSSKRYWIRVSKIHPVKKAPSGAFYSKSWRYIDVCGAGIAEGIDTLPIAAFSHCVRGTSWPYGNGLCAWASRNVVGCCVGGEEFTSPPLPEALSRNLYPSLSLFLGSKPLALVGLAGPGPAEILATELLFGKDGAGGTATQEHW